ncbi:vanadium-dependent haloperoxidase [Tundrisphaera lichenicola]|uniref:vanadium-dependent haloperoxidase n=1 Tax=Tundrisphaera lichenicola TaxID=2029860 RepID=UPI003EB8ED2D
MLGNGADRPAGSVLDKHPRPATQAGAAVIAAATTSPVESEFDRACALGSNGDEARYASKIGNFHKGLKHNNFGEVDLASFATLRAALDGRQPSQFEAIELGGTRKLVNPQAGLAEDTEGPDPAELSICAAPRLDSAAAAGEAVELYWMALLRDVPFARFHSDPIVARAATDLSALSDFHGPRDPMGRITPATIFRGNARGDLAGPFVSQFLLKDIPYGSLTISQLQRTVVPGIDYLTSEESWRAIQDGSEDVPQDEYDPNRRHIRSMRDLGQYVHVDALYEAYLNAALILLGMNAPVDPGNPYAPGKSTKQIGFGTFGGPHLLSLVTEVATRALKAVWYQKWFVHLRLRPEAYGGLVHFVKTGQKTTADYPVHDDVLNSDAVQATFDKYGTYLMPMAFPEGSPTHPSYGAGHATVAGACVTILKAWFDEDAAVSNPVRSNLDGTALDPYVGPDLTIGGELNKIAANIAIGRNMAGVHWRSDYVQSLKLGEQVALCILLQQSTDYNEENTLSLTRFNGQKVTIKSGKLLDENGVKIPFNC